jgi:hypothetical protein
MTVLRAVQVGTATAQAAIDAVEQYGADADTLVLRLGVVQLLKLQQEDMAGEDEDAYLIEAYRNWIGVALRYYGPEPDATLREYARASATLSAELQIAAVRPPVPGDDGAAASPASTGPGPDSQG